MLKKQGINVKGTVIRRIDSNSTSSPLEKGGERGILSNGKSPLSPPLQKGGNIGTEVARIGSQDIYAYIRDTNQQSLNVAADNLFLLLGERVYGSPGTREKGIQAVNGFMSELGVSTAGFVVNDGSGISEHNRVSAEQMVGFLRAVARKPWFNSFHESLSRPGIDGRLKELGYRSEHMRLKSGQVRDAYCLAGYVDQKSSKRIAFAYMVNGQDANTTVANDAVIEVLKQLEQ
jgi:D-alanyl-D-alanine carboxypeptidase/D-alanyl-D-alanine-endopeptidase (penicillin-binding protein 4)